MRSECVREDTGVLKKQRAVGVSWGVGWNGVEQNEINLAVGVGYVF